MQRNRTQPIRRSGNAGRAWHTPITLLLAGLGLCGAVLLEVTKTQSATSSERIEAYAFADVSVSNGPHLDLEFALLEYAVDEELPANTPLALYAFSNREQSWKMYRGVPDSGMALWGIQRELAEMVNQQDEGTHPETAIRAMADAADVSTADASVCFLLWDGEVSGDIREFSKQVQRLADNPKIAAVVCIGIIPDKGIRSRAEAAMRSLSDRLIVCGSNDRSEIKRVSNLIKLHQSKLGS